MRNPTKSLFAKIVAILLLVLVFILGISSAIGIAYGYEQGYYSGVSSYYETQACKDITSYYAYSVCPIYNSNAQQEYWNGFGMDQTNFAFELSSAYESDLFIQNYIPETVGYKAEFTMNEYTIKCSVRDPITAQDRYYNSHRIYEFLYPLRNQIIWICALSAVFFLIDLIFLLCAAGHRKGTEEVVRNHQDKIPLDLYLTAAAVAGGWLLSVMFGDTWINTPVDVILYFILVLIFFLICLATVMTLATRIKYGKFWRNTIIYRLIKLLGKIMKFIGKELASTFKNIPMVWKTALVFCGADIINFILCALLWNVWPEFFMLFLLFVFNLMLLFAVCLISINLLKLKKAGEQLAAGDFEFKVDTAKMYWEFKKHAENLNNIGNGMSIAVDQRMKSERLKTELITNVSHDIKTPLTSIINYVDLLQKEKIEGQAGEYIEVLNRQSKRLKKLTEDLVEASKAATGNLAVELERTDIGEIINQSVGEYTERLAAGHLEAVISVPEEDVYVMTDGKLLWRVIDNLLSNVCKYSQPDTRVYIDVKLAAGEVIISFKNISRNKLNIAADELLERFVRGDGSRTTEGSGLGLNIAKSLVNLLKGTFEIYVDGDLFKAEIRFAQAGVEKSRLA